MQIACRVLCAQVMNSGDTTAYGARLAVAADGTLYRAERTVVPLPALVPGLPHTLALAIDTLEPDLGRSGDVVLTLMSPNAGSPAACARLTMPISELAAGG